LTDDLFLAGAIAGLERFRVEFLERVVLEHRASTPSVLVEDVLELVDENIANVRARANPAQTTLDVRG